MDERVQPAKLLESIRAQAKTCAWVEPDDRQFFRSSGRVQDATTVQAVQQREETLLYRAVARQAVRDILAAKSPDGRDYEITVASRDKDVMVTRHLDAIMSVIGGPWSENTMLITQKRGERFDPDYPIMKVHFGNEWGRLEYKSSPELDRLLQGANDLVAGVQGAVQQHTADRPAEVLRSIREQVESRVFKEPDDVEYFRSKPWLKSDADVERVLIARAVARDVVKAILVDKDLMEINVINRNAITLNASRDCDAVMQDLMGDSENELLIEPVQPFAARGRAAYMVVLDYDRGPNVIRDYSDRIESVVRPSLDFAGGIQDIVRAERVVEHERPTDRPCEPS